MKPLIYISGPFSEPDPVANTRNAIHVGMSLYDTGVAAVEIPHLSLFAHFFEWRPVEFWHEFAEDKLLHCDGLWRMNGKSKGADQEVKRAFNYEIPIFFEHDHDWPELISFCTGQS